VFSSENGNSVENMLVCETDRRAPWYRVEDPESLGRRVELVNNKPTYIMVVARRVSDVKIFATTPQQSDYVSFMGARQETHSLGRPTRAQRQLRHIHSSTSSYQEAHQAGD